jgi:hypothetical protein
MLHSVERIVVSAEKISILLKHGRSKGKPIEIPWKPKPKSEARLQLAAPEAEADQKLLKSIVRAHAWLHDLSTNRQTSIDALAKAVDVHPKVIRQGLRLAFLAPRLTTSALRGQPLLALKQIPKHLPLAWHGHSGPFG